MEKDIKMQKLSKCFHSEKWKLLLKLTRECSILVLLIIFGRGGSWIFPLTPHAAFLSGLGVDHAAVSPLHTTQLWSGLAHDAGFGVALSTDSFTGRYPAATEKIFWPGCSNLQWKDKHKWNSLYFFVIEIVNILYLSDTLYSSLNCSAGSIVKYDI